MPLVGEFIEIAPDDVFATGEVYLAPPADPDTLPEGLAVTEQGVFIEPTLKTTPLNGNGVLEKSRFTQPRWGAIESHAEHSGMTGTPPETVLINNL